MTWTNIDFLLVRSSGIHPRAISQWMSKLRFLSNEFENQIYKITATSPMANVLSGKEDENWPPVNKLGNSADNESW